MEWIENWLGYGTFSSLLVRNLNFLCNQVTLKPYPMTKTPAKTLNKAAYSFANDVI